MRYLDLLYESIHRSLAPKLSLKRKRALHRALIRNQFFKDLEISQGKVLLHFFELSEKYTFHTKTADVSYFLTETLGIKLKTWERSIVFDYLKDIGAHWRRTSNTTYFSNLKIKEEYATYSINGVVEHKPPKRPKFDEFF